MNKLVKVNGTNYIRDTQSMAIMNTDTAARDEYYDKVRILNNQKSEINKVNQEINQIKSDMSEIKDLLKQLLTK